MYFFSTNEHRMFSRGQSNFFGGRPHLPLYNEAVGAECCPTRNKNGAERPLDSFFKDKGIPIGKKITANNCCL